MSTTRDTSGRAVVPSRAALAGNPSDGFGGAVCSVIVPAMEATAVVVGAREGSREVLVTTTIDRFRADSAPGLDADIGIEVSTTIPRSVGLAGSSAIVIACIRALSMFTGIDLTDDEVAEMAHVVERHDLAIAGGWQDQVVQSRAISGLMEFGSQRSHRPLRIADEPPIPLYLAWLERLAADSGSSHSALRAEPPSAEVIDALAAEARRAAEALETRHVHELKAAIDATFDLRLHAMRVDDAQRSMVDLARAHGAAANFAGSGGAIVGVLPKDGAGFVDEMKRHGLRIITWSAR